MFMKISLYLLISILLLKHIMWLLLMENWDKVKIFRFLSWWKYSAHRQEVYVEVYVFENTLPSYNGMSCKIVMKICYAFLSSKCDHGISCGDYI